MYLPSSEFFSEFTVNQEVASLYAKLLSKRVEKHFGIDGIFQNFP